MARVLMRVLIASAAWCASAYAAGEGGAQAVPAGLLACSNEADSVRRLACFDREIKRFTEPTIMATPGVMADRPPAIPPAAAPPAAAPAIAASSPAPPPIQAAAGVAPAHAASPPELRHIRARVESVERDSENFLILKLDNHETWKQQSESPAELHIRAGDTVSIDRELGAYHLSDRLGTSVSVRRIGP